MWECIVEVYFVRSGPDGDETISRIERLQFPRGRLPTRDEMIQEALEVGQEWLDQLHETIGNRPYDYSGPTGARVLGCSFIK